MAPYRRGADLAFILTSISFLEGYYLGIWRENKNYFLGVSNGIFLWKSFINRSVVSRSLKTGIKSLTLWNLKKEFVTRIAYLDRQNLQQIIFWPHFVNCSKSLVISVGVSGTYMRLYLGLEKKYISKIPSCSEKMSVLVPHPGNLEFIN